MKSTLVFACLVLSVLACAGPTGLYLMPIADILRHREAALSAAFQQEGRDCAKASGLTIGVADRLELGFDQDLAGGTTYNAKLLLFEGKHGALSAGLANCTAEACDPYFVGRLDLPGFRLHSGVWRTSGATRFIAGADFQLGSRCIGSLETTTGRESQAWLMAVYNVPKMDGLVLQLSIGLPLHHERAKHAIGLTHAFRL